MRILIVEDESVAAKGLEKLVREIYGKEITSLKIERSLLGSECFLEENSVDLVFLDLNLDGREGFDLLRTIIAESFHTIIVSGMTEKAIQAFEFGVLDFVPKPVNKERLKKALQKWKNVEANSRYTKFLSIKKEDKTEIIPIKEITYIQGQDNKTMIHRKNLITDTHRKTLDSLSKVLPSHFFRVHKSYLVNLRETKFLRNRIGGKYILELKNGIEIPVSRKIFPELKKRMG
ncbi:MAG: response regulator transcription factor [Leptospiraceae bacterium]|nr:response regulator transcription factor [Leptospiraceae bacterium]